MLELGPHGSFIIAAYVFAGLALIGLFIWIIVDLRQQTRILARLEAVRAMRPDDTAIPGP